METERDSVELQALRSLQADIGGEIVGNKLFPIGDALSQFVGREQLTCDVEGNWYAVCAEQRQQKLAVKSVADAGIPAYLPLVYQAVPHGRGQVRYEQRSMFGPYFFARCVLNSENRHKITCSRGVHRMLDNAGNGHPPALSPEEMEVIRLHEADSAEREAERVAKEEAAKIARAGGRSGITWHFSAGDKVRIKSGPFAGFYAELESAVDTHDRLTALVKLFGRKPRVDLSAFDIEAL